MGKTTAFFFFSEYFLHPLFLCVFKLLYFSKWKNVSCSANKSDHKREINNSYLFCICIKWKIQTEDMPLSICFLSFAILQNRQCVERETWWREKKQEADLGWWRVCVPALLFVSVKYVQVNHSSVCVSISKPVYLPNSHLIFLYLYSDRKLICTLCTVCWIYPNRDFTPTVAITFIEREKYNRMKVFYCSQNIYQCGLMQLQNAGLPESLRMLVAHKYCLISRACFQLCITELPK